MIRRLDVVVALSLAVATPPAARGQVPLHSAHHASQDSGAAVGEFVRQARTGTERYKDQSVAVEDGYRRLGPDFPAMGEHWANPELVAKGALDAARPGLLTYARVNGVATLTGVVYAIPLADGELPPASPFDPSHWHDHLGTVDEESLLLDHDARQSPSSGLRLAVLHLWVWVDNPAGRSVTDNWALPFARLGLVAPASAPVGAARALSLLSGSVRYYARLAHAAGAPSDEEHERIGAALERGGEHMRAWWTSRGSSASLAASELASLDEAWIGIWREIERNVAPDVARRLRAVWQP